MGGPMGGLFGKRDSGGGRDDIEDLRVPPPGPQSLSAASSPPPSLGNPFAGANGSPGLRPPMPPVVGGPLAGLSPKDIMALAATGAGGLGVPGGGGREINRGDCRMLLRIHVPGWAVTWKRGLVNNFLRVPLLAWVAGQLQYNSGTLRK